MRQTSKTFFTDEERARIDEAVKQAELNTSGEIVPVLATQAAPYDRGLFYASFMFAILATLALIGLYCMPLDFLAHAPWEIPLYVLLPVQVVALLAGYYLAQVNPDLHRPFVPHAFMQQRVNRAAHQAFYQFHLTHTREATGIMLYVSLFERAVVVLADKAIDEKHEQQTWDKVRDLLVDGLRAGDAVEGFEKALAECGRILEEDFPIREDDTNELPNHLRLL